MELAPLGLRHDEQPDVEHLFGGGSVARRLAARPTGAHAGDASADVIKRLAPRWFVARNLHRTPSVRLLQSRTTLSWLRGPMTRADLMRLKER